MQKITCADIRCEDCVWYNEELNECTNYSQVSLDPKYQTGEKR